MTRGAIQNTERRSFPVVELRVESGGDETRRIVGHAAVFESLSEDLGGFRERIAPGAFAASIAEDDIRALFNHDPNLVLGRNRSGTLRLAEDERGLAMAIDLPDTQAARDLAVMVDRGDVSQASFGFQTISDEFQMIDGDVVRTLSAVRLFDVSPVTFAAYPQTEVAARSLETWKAAQRDPDAWRADLALRRRRLDLEAL